MKYIVVDLEMNNVAYKSGVSEICGNETIEIGAVMLDDNLQEISSFRSYVKPEYNDVINRKITKLTGITTEMVSMAPSFNEALRMFTTWCLGIGDEVTLYAWSETDYSQISREIALKNYDVAESEKRILEVEWQDFQNEFDVNLGFEHQLSLKMALDMAGIEFVGHQHDALDDARNTAELLHVFKDKNLFDLTLKKIADVMTPKTGGFCLGEMFDLSAYAVS